jgi:hypothetical protein
MTTKRTLAVGAGITAIAATVTTPLLAGTAAASRTQSFTLRMHAVSETTVDNDKSGFSAGDVDVQTSRLTKGGSAVGYEVGDCLTTRVAKTADQLCHFVFHLHKGQIVAVGAVRAGQSGPGTFTLAITGGTDTYAAARGEVSITATRGGSVPAEIDIRY